jgi:hypothetical protein
METAQGASSNRLDSTDRWPSGLRRQLKVVFFGYTSVSLVRKGVGSNPTLFNIFFASVPGYRSRKVVGDGGSTPQGCVFVLLVCSVGPAVDP